MCATLIRVKRSEDKQNITLALPKRLLRRVKVAAAERETSMSAIIVRLLEDFLRGEGDYERAMRDEISRMRRGYELGSEGKAAWTRDALHER